MDNTKYYIFNGTINDETVKPLIDFINSNRDPITISFTSTGGEMEVGRFLTHVLNENKERITLCAVNYIYSCAFKIFKMYTGKKLITFGCGGMYHYTSQMISTTYDGVPNYKYEGAAQLSSMQDCKKENLKFCEGFMSAKELSNYKKNIDVHFSFSRMKQINKDAEII